MKNIKTILLGFLKKNYQLPFSRELSSPFLLVFYETLMFFLGCFYRLRYRKELGLTSEFLRSKKLAVEREGRSVFVFANGPSLGGLDLNKVSGYCKERNFDLIAINSYLSKSGDVLLPTMAVFADNVHFSGNEDSQYFKDVKVCRDGGVPIFLPAKYYAHMDGVRFAYNGLCSVFSKNTSNVLKPAGYYGVTAFFALSLAKNLGYKKIYICGFDNSYFKDFDVKDSGEMVIRHKHYYNGANDNTEVSCLYPDTAGFFFDVYRHFYYIAKITKGCPEFFNVARTSYLSFVPRDFSLNIYKDNQREGGDENQKH